jgi:nicotinamide-nucleotide adenylyltransferase
MDESIARALQALDKQPAATARQFDDGPRIAGPLVVLPSAFNPPTLAHQHLLERAAEFAGARPVALLTTRNVDKAIHGASLAQRIEMLLALRRELPELAVLACNQARIMDQAPALRKSFEQGVAELDLRFVVGFDTLERLFASRYYTDMEAELTPFFERCRVIAANRAGMSAGDVVTWVAENAGSFAARIDILEINPYAASLSSSDVRESVQSGGEAETVPGVVQKYIEAQGLYREDLTDA